MIIQSNKANYSAHFCENLTFLQKWQETNTNFWVIDKKVYCLYKSHFDNILPANLFLFDALEDDKTLESVLKICEAMVGLDSKRNTQLISVGGGITNDVCGFVASILYRGISHILVPTTLLAAADSCLGGKTGVNFLKYKNLLGSFYTPKEIFICPLFFETLSQDDFCSGLGEIAKMALLAGEKVFSNFEQDVDLLLHRDFEKTILWVKKSLELKQEFVEKDEFEKGIREHLNFGHTFGHAIEVATNYEIPHGQAVALGILKANRFASTKNILFKENLQRIESVLNKIITVNIKEDYFNENDLNKFIKKDKKQKNEQVYLLLLNDEFLIEKCLYEN